MQSTGLVSGSFGEDYIVINYVIVVLFFSQKYTHKIEQTQRENRIKMYKKTI